MRRWGALLVVGLLAACGAQPPELPPFDPSGLEPDVAALLEERRDAAMAEPRASTLAALGDALFAHRRHSEALPVYLLAAEAEGHGGERFRCLHLAALSAGEQDEVRSAELFRRALAIRADYDATWVKAGMALEELGRAEEAARCYDAALALSRTPLALVGRGRTELATGDPRAAIPYLEEARLLDRSVLEAAVALAAAYARLGWAEEAERAADEAAALDSPSPIYDPIMNAVLDLSVSYQGRLESANRAARLGALDRSFALIDQAIESLPTRIEGHLAAGTLLAQIGRNEAALSAFDAVLAREPAHAETLTRKGGVLAVLGRRGEAETALRAATAASPSSAFARFELARFLEPDRSDDALALVDQLLAERPNLRTGHLLRARLMLARDRLDEADAHVTRVLRRHPTDAAAQALRGALTRRRAGD